MRKQQIISLLLFLAFLAPGARAAKRSWDQVKKLERGMPLIVRMDDRPKFKCYFYLATDDELVCLPPLRLRNLPSTPLEYHLDRNQIREIRKAHTGAVQGVVEDAVLGGAIGAMYGTAAPSSARGRDVAIAAGAGAIIAFVVDHVFPLFHHGAIYRR